jgi:WD40 repeat protein
VEKAAGLPLYVHYVIKDILAGRQPDLITGGWLPESLDHYHAALLRRCAIGDLHQVLTPLVATLAVAKEPVVFDALVELLRRRDVLPDIDAEGLLRRSLSAVGSIVRRASTPELKDGFTLFHHSLRQHIENSNEMKGALSTAQRSLCGLALALRREGGAAAGYLHRGGVRHLLDANRTDDAISLMADFAYTMARLKRQFQTLQFPTAAVRAVSEDWRSLARFVGAGPESAWEEFWRTEEHTLLAGTDHWPPHKILLQLAFDYANTSPFTVAASKWLESGGCDWTWMHVDPAFRPERPSQSGTLFVLEGHRDWVNACALCADRPLAVSGGGRKTGDFFVRLWNLDTHQCMAAYEGHHADVRGVAITPAATRVFSGSLDGTVRVWDIGSGQCVKVLEHGSPVHAIALSADGSRLLSGTADGKIHRWDTNTFEDRVIYQNSGPVNCLACDGDFSRTVWGGDSGELTLWDLQSGTGRPLAGHSRPIMAVAMTADGRYAASGAADGEIRHWDLSQAACLRTWTHEPDSICAVALDGNGQRVYSGCREGSGNYDVLDRSVQIWDARDGVLLKQLTGHADRVLSLAVSPDGSRLLSSGSDYTLRLWEPQLATAKASDLIYIAGIQALPGGLRCLSASDDGSVCLWDLAGARIERRFAGHSNVAWQAVLSPDGRLAASASEDGTVRLWDVQSGRQHQQLVGHDGRVFSVSFRPDGRCAVSAGGEVSDSVTQTTLCIWDLHTGECLQKVAAHEDRIEYVQTTPDGWGIVSSSWNRTVRLSNFREGSAVRTMISPGRDLVGFALTPDGRRCLSGDEGGVVRAWDLGTGECAATFTGHTDYFRRVSISSDGRCMITGSDDRSARIWDLKSGECLAAAFFPAWVTAVDFLANSYDAVVGLANGEVRVVRMTPTRSAGAPFATTTRLWHFDLTAVAGAASAGNSVQQTIPGQWDEHLSALCAWCGSRFVPSAAALEAIRSINSILRPGESPCLSLPEQAWNESELLSTCGQCRRPVRFQPWIVDFRT